MWSATALSPGIIKQCHGSDCAQVLRGLSFGSPGSIGADRIGAKCRKPFEPRERINARAKHQQRNTGFRVFNALSYAHQPNRRFKGTPILRIVFANALCAPLNLSVSLFASSLYWPCLLAWFCSLKASTAFSFARHNVRERHIWPRLLSLSFKR